MSWKVGAVMTGVAMFLVGGIWLWQTRMVNGVMFVEPRLLRDAAGDERDGGYGTSVPIPVTTSGTLEIVYFLYRRAHDYDYEGDKPPYRIVRMNPQTGEKIDVRDVAPLDLGHDWPADEYLPPGFRERKQTKARSGWPRLNKIAHEVWSQYAAGGEGGDCALCKEYRALVYQLGGESLRPYYEFLMVDFEAWLEATE